MNEISRIVVPIDFSASSDAAIRLAVTMAQRFDAELILLHVVEPQFAAYAGLPMMPVINFASEAEQAATAALRHLEAKLDETLKKRWVIRHGSAWNAILEEARAQDANLIVMSTSGHTGLARALLGSTTEKVVRLSSIPVLTVHAAKTP